MAKTVTLVLLLAAIFAFFAAPLQRELQAALRRRPALLWLAPLLLTAVFVAASVVASAVSLPQTLVVLAYTCTPVLCRYKLGNKLGGKLGASADFLTILLLWLPIEFAAGITFVPRASYGFLHTVIYGIAILLGLALFLTFRPIGGMKFNLPRGWRDIWLPLVGFVLVAPVLIAVGISIGFIPPPHLPVQPAGKMAAAIGIIFAGTALPEEILFRALIQNLMMQRFGATWRTLFWASFVFGCAHLDNGPQALPNWRYMIVATIAGVAYGRVFQKSSSVVSSAMLHMMVDWTKHFIF
jgi:membrane protease YdiL (CAAX protease family)